MGANKAANEAKTNDTVNGQIYDTEILSETALRQLSKTFASMMPKESHTLSAHDTA